VKLTEKEAKTLACVDLRSDAPISLIQKESGLREHTIRHALRSLLRRQVITPVPFINLHRLGLTIYTIFFTVSGEKRGSHEALIKALIAAPEIIWVGEFGGEFQYGIALATKRFQDFALFMSEISKKHGSVFHDKAISIEISFTMYPRRYLTSRKLSTNPIKATFDDREPVAIDQIDSRILSAIATDGTISHRQLSQRLNIPLSTMELRLRKLKQQGVIAGEIYGVDAAKFEIKTFKLLVYTKGLDGSLTDKIDQYCRLQPNITALIACVGSWGYEINVEVQHSEELSLIIQQLYEFFGNSIHTIKTLTKFSYPKARFFVDLSVEKI
jgi:DNA-binding Lrp family transcriptional regulator